VNWEGGLLSADITGNSKDNIPVLSTQFLVSLINSENNSSHIAVLHKVWKMYFSSL